MIGFPKQNTDFNTSLYKKSRWDKNFDSQIQSYLNESLLTKDKKEEWKFFPFQKVFSQPFQFQTSASVVEQAQACLKDSICLYVKNGVPSIPKHPSLEVISFETFLKNKKNYSSSIQEKVLLSLKKERNHLAILNNLFYPKGFLLIVKEKIKQPIEIHYNQDSSLEKQGLNIRNFIFLEKSTSVDILEFFYSRHSGLDLFLNIQTDCFLEKSAQLNYFSFDHLSSQDTLIHQVFSHVEKKAQAYFFNLSLNAGLSRWLKHIEQEEDSVSWLRGLSLLSGQSLSDHKTQVRHQGLKGRSDQLFKSFLFDSARYVFQGLIRIDKTADESETNLLNKNYLFSPHSSVVSFPELDIFPANVKAAHGTATAPFFENNALVFYLKSRGIDPYLSFHLVLLSLLKETFSDCPLSIQNIIRQTVETKLLSLEKTELSNIL